MTTFPNKINACERISSKKFNLKYDFKALLTASIPDLILLLRCRMGFLLSLYKVISLSCLHMLWYIISNCSGDKCSK